MFELKAILISLEDGGMLVCHVSFPRFVGRVNECSKGMKKVQLLLLFQQLETETAIQIHARIEKKRGSVPNSIQSRRY